ncbi:hypothetical protein LIER_26826 [Lithospermum erythrorhizon]|uniref:DYW domain-containing protein n=1 Tax=Lithospermum erythrorhizon TaxID=34254 RepID=A0AAV3RD61_LITER
MRRLGIEPNGYSFVALLSACMRLFDVKFGFQVHAYLLKLGYLCCTYVGNALMGLYSKCGCSDFVIELFDYMLVRDVASWNTAISCMVKESMFDSAFELFRKMFEINGLGADDYTISSLLCACGGCSAVMKGRELHAHAIKIGYESNLNVNNALIGFYSKLGSLKEVKSLFESVPQRDVYTWTEMVTAYMKFGIVDAAVEVFEKIPCKNCVSYNALLAGFCNNGEGSRAFNLFCTMVEEGVELTDYALTSALNACGLMKQRGTSEQIHAFVLKVGCGKNEHIEASLIDMCTRCDRMRDAEQMYHKLGLDLINSVMLTTMICAYARNGQPEEAFSLFCKYKSEIYLVADEALVAAIIGVCGTLGLHDLGEQIYSQAIKGGFLSDIGIGNSMISMYSKCGKIKDASIIFDNMQKHDTVSWNCLIAGYVLHRLGNKALNVWEKMKLVGEIPDSVTTLLVISAYGCTNHNLIDSCRDLLHSMQSTYQIKPTMEHYACFIRVLGYWGLLEEAEAIVNKMPFEPGPPIWRALLDSCRLGLNTTIGKRVAKNILSMEPQDTSTYILKSNLYSASGRWHCSEVVRNEMREKGFRKLPGRSWIIYQNMVHSFFARDKSHPQCKDIYSGLEILVMECIKAGYVPDTSFVLHEVEEYQKKEFLFYHSSKLAVTFGLLMSKPGKPIRVMKNIVLCGDCHTFFKYVSVVTKRDVYIRDASGFHCFVNGKCSCNDYW